MPDPDDALTPKPPESPKGHSKSGPEKGLETARLGGQPRSMWGKVLAFFASISWPHWATRALLYTTGSLAGLFLLGTGAFFLALWLYEPDLSLKSDLYALNRPPAFIFEDGEGHTIGRRGAVIGERLKLYEMPAYLPAAFLAMEDRRFYEHGGLDYRGPRARAVCRRHLRAHRAGRLDHHPATGQDHLPHAREDDVAQARGNGGGARAGRIGSPRTRSSNSI